MYIVKSYLKLEDTDPAAGCAHWWTHVTVAFGGIRLVLNKSSAPFFPFLKASNPGLIRSPSKKNLAWACRAFYRVCPHPAEWTKFAARTRPRSASLTTHVKKNIVTMNKYSIPFSTVNNQQLPSLLHHTTIFVKLYINKFMKLFRTLQYDTIYYHWECWIHLIKNKCIIAYTSMTTTSIFNSISRLMQPVYSSRCQQTCTCISSSHKPAALEC
jgi:hypothetical protein